MGYRAPKLPAGTATIYTPEEILTKAKRQVRDAFNKNANDIETILEVASAIDAFPKHILGIPLADAIAIVRGTNERR
jgi:hypothetical protein